MRIKLLSDLHLEGHPFTYHHHGEDVLVLAGDIHTKNRHEDFLKSIPENVQILMVKGNHEIYQQPDVEVDQYLYDLEKRFKNFKFLNNTEVEIQGVPFYGGIMCTDFHLYAKNDPSSVVDSVLLSKRNINDFRIGLKNTATLWTIEDHITEHKSFCSGLDKWLEKTKNKQHRVIVSHFIPSPECIAPQFRGGPSEILNAYFVSDMQRYIDHHHGVWMFGHTHTSWNMPLGKMHLYCNPKGYGAENKLGFDESFQITLHGH